MFRNRLLAVLLLATAGAAGCTASNTSGSAADFASAPVPAEAPAADRGESSGGSGKDATGRDAKAEAPQAAQVAQPGVDRKLIRTATLDVTAPEVVAAVAEARGIVADAGGYSGREQVDQRYATVTLHVPSDQFDRVLAELAQRVGKVTSSSQTAEDVTEQLVDVESRISTQRASVQRVRALLAKATSIDDIVRVEAEVSSREAELESLLKRRETLSGQVAVSTVTLRIKQSGEAPPVVEEEDDGLLGALGAGWTAFTDSLAFLLRFVALVLPFAVVIAVAGVLVWRRWGRRVRPAREAPEPA